MGGTLQRWNPQEWPVAADWKPVLEGFLASPAGEQLGGYIRGRLAAGATIYPPRPLRALELTPLHSVRAVILGQDPYHGPGQAHGLCFSVPDGLPTRIDRASMRRSRRISSNSSTREPN